jgi:hypothetical protein
LECRSVAAIQKGDGFACHILGGSAAALSSNGTKKRNDNTNRTTMDYQRPSRIPAGRSHDRIRSSSITERAESGSDRIVAPMVPG